jgi:hypothetical protein
MKLSDGFQCDKTFRIMPPILEITDGRGNLIPMASHVVLATMFYPDDNDKRQHYLETMHAKVLLEAGVPLSKMRKNFAARLAEEFESSADSAAGSGYGVTVAGDLLLFIINASPHSPKDASLERAVRVWSEDQALGKTVDGHSVAASRRSIISAWSKFKPVAHLCAAWRLSQHEAPTSNPAVPEELANFLAFSETLRLLGEGHHPPAGRTGSKPHLDSTLDPETTWRTPSDLALPQVTLGIPPLTEYATGILKRYHAD